MRPILITFYTNEQAHVKRRIKNHTFFFSKAVHGEQIVKFRAGGVTILLLLPMSNRLDKELSPNWLHLHKQEVII